MNTKNIRSVFSNWILTAIVFLTVAFTLTSNAQSRPDSSRFAVRATKQSIPKVERSAKPSRTKRVAFVQPSEVTNSTNYVFTTNTSGTFTDMTGSTQLVAAGQDDTASANTPIGFEFWLQGVRYTQFSATSNGFVGLSSTGGVVASNNYTIANGTSALPLISACGGDLETGATTGKVHYKVTGSAPNRILTVEFRNMGIVYNNTTPDGTYQVRLYETTGQIEFVYGSMSRGPLTGSGVGNSGNLGIGYSVAAANGSLVSIVSATNTATTTTPFTQQSYATGPIPNLDSPTEGARRVYLLTPGSVTAPTNLTFSGVTPIAMTLNWTDSPDEVVYGIYRSTDNVNFTFVGTAAQNATSFNATGLTANTTYFWQVRAISDGAVSSALTGSQATAAPGVVTSTAAGGPWSSTATWAGGVVPTNTDDVTIVSGATVTIDTTAVALDVTVNNGGTLLWDTAAARSLTTGVNVTIDNGGTFSSGATGTVTTHVLSVGGNLTNNGTLDFSTNSNTAGAGITFTGAAANTFGGTGGTTDIRTMTINKSANTNVLELNPTNFTVQGVNTDVAGFLTLTSGTLKISGNFTMTNRVFTTANYAIGSTAGLWLNNPNFTVAGQASAATLTGLFRVSQGTYNIGTATGNSLGFNANATIIVDGGIINSTGRFGVASATNTISYNQSSGTITVCTIGNTSTTLGSFDLGTSATSNVVISGGTIICQLAASTIDYRYDSSPSGLTGGTVQLGNANSGAAKAFNLRGVLPSLVITNTTGNHTATFSNTLVNFYHVITGNVTINTGNTLNLAGNTTSVNTFFEGNILNNGILNASNTNMDTLMVATGLQTYSGTGTMTAPTTRMDVDGGGVDFSGATNQQVITRINLFTGTILGANKITLGNGGTTSAFMQIGNGGAPATTTGPVSGTIVNNAGSGGYTIFYGDVDADRNTGGEIPASRTVTNLTFDTEGANITIAGGDLMATGTITFGDAADTGTNGRVITGANNLILGSAGTVSRVGGLGHVDGNFLKNFATNASKTFEVGTANGYSPVTVNMTAGAPAPFTVKAVQAAQPNIPDPTKALQRYWTLTASGVTADLTFNYLDPIDIPGTANENNFVIFKYDGSLTMPGGSVNTGANTATITGVTAFSDWTLAEPNAPLVASSAVSRLTHNGTDYDIALPLSGPAGIECRNNGGNYRILLTFGSNVTFSGAAVTGGTGSVGGTSGSGTNTIEVDLTGVTNAQYVTVTLQGATNGTNSGDIPVTMGVLVGDTTGDGQVNSSDISQTKARAGQTLTGTNFVNDVNVDGDINSADISLVKARSGTALP